MWTWKHTIGALAVVGGLYYFGPAAVCMGCKGKSNRALIASLAAKWGPIFGCPASTILTISKIESSWRVDCCNTNERAMLRGGAWGPMQVTLATAIGIAAKLATHSSTTVRATLSRWDKTGPGLKDPDVNVMFAAEFLGRLTREFGAFERVAAAYHQGAGKVRAMDKAQQAIPAELPPKGKAYVTRALSVRKELVG